MANVAGPDVTAITGVQLLQRCQPTWNPDASIAWKVEWSRAGFRDIVRYCEQYHPYMLDLAIDCLLLRDAELRRRLWPHGEPA